MFQIGRTFNFSPKRVLSAGLIAGLVLGTTACGTTTADGGNNKAAGGNNTLTISTMTENRYLQTAIDKFKAEHPEVTIKVDQYSTSAAPAAQKGADAAAAAGAAKNSVIMTQQDPKDVEKYVNTVNTQLMSGQAADIIALSSLPYEKYADKNLLANLSQLMQADQSFDESKYYSNILDAMKYKGSMYAMPLTVSMNMLAGNKTLLDQAGVKIDDNTWTWQEFLQAAEKAVNTARQNGHQNMYALNGMSDSLLISNLMNREYNDFVDKSSKKANFDSQEFIDLLNLSKDMIDNNLINTDVTAGKAADLASRGNTVFSDTRLSGSMSLLTAKTSYSDGVNWYKEPGQGSGLAFTSSELYGINNNSPNKDLAWEFLKFLLSEQMMSDQSLGMSGFPINKAAFQTRFQNDANMANQGKMKLNMNGQAITVVPLNQDEQEMLSGRMSKLNTYTNADSKIISIVQEECKAFFAGQKTAQETAKVIQSRVNTYISE